VTRFNSRIKELTEKTDLDANELCVGDIIKNINPECKHFKSKGKVVGVKKLLGDTGSSGKLIRYVVLNKGKTFKPGDRLEKTEIQLTKESLAGVGHLALDVVGLIPGVGEIADATNAAWYAGEAARESDPEEKKSKYLMAALSLVSVIPVVGDAVGKGGKLAVYIAKGAKALKGTGKVGRVAAKGMVKGTKAVRKATSVAGPKVKKAQEAVKKNKRLIDKVLTKASENEKLAPHVTGMKDAINDFGGTAPERNEVAGYTSYKEEMR
jgi:hypothetical protein